MEKQSNSLLKAGGLLLGGILIGYLLTTVFINSSCPKPQNLRLVQKDISTLTVSWDAPAASARSSYYLIVRDSIQPDSIYSLEAVDGNTATVKNLKPGTKYFIDVYTICQLTVNPDKTVRADISVSPITISATTDYVIIADILPDATNCPFNNCNTNVTLSQPGNALDWSAIPEGAYKIEIGNLSAPGTILCTNYLHKVMLPDNIMKIEISQYIPCTNAPISPEPAKRCSPFATSLCGSFMDTSSGTPVKVSYTIDLLKAKFQVNLPSSGYFVKVNSCGTTVERPSGPTTK